MNESILDDGLSLVPIPGEQENKQYHREPWVKERVTTIEVSMSEWRQIRKPGGLVKCVTLGLDIPEFKSQLFYVLNVL